MAFWDYFLIGVSSLASSRFPSSDILGALATLFFASSLTFFNSSSVKALSTISLTFMVTPFNGRSKPL